MAFYRRRDAWDHTGSIVAKVHNVNVAKQYDMIAAEKLNPYRSPSDEAEELTPKIKKELREIFNGGKRKRNSSR